MTNTITTTTTNNSNNNNNNNNNNNLNKYSSLQVWFKNRRAKCRQQQKTSDKSKLEDHPLKTQGKSSTCRKFVHSTPSDDSTRKDPHTSPNSEESTSPSLSSLSPSLSSSSHLQMTTKPQSPLQPNTSSFYRLSPLLPKDTAAMASCFSGSSSSSTSNFCRQRQYSTSPAADCFNQRYYYSSPFLPSYNYPPTFSPQLPLSSSSPSFGHSSLYSHASPNFGPSNANSVNNNSWLSFYNTTNQLYKDDGHVTSYGGYEGPLGYDEVPQERREWLKFQSL